MDKKPMLVVLLLALALVVAYVGFIASVPTVIEKPTAVGEVNLVVTPSAVSSSAGEVTLVVV